MVECVAVQLDNVSLPADMFSVALFAFCIADFFVLAMKAFMSPEILINFFVALSTQAGLLFFIKSLVTFVALEFIFSVALNDFTRHDQCFPGGAVGVSPKCRCGQYGDGQ